MGESGRCRALPVLSGPQRVSVQPSPAGSGTGEGHSVQTVPGGWGSRSLSRGIPVPLPGVRCRPGPALPGGRCSRSAPGRPRWAAPVTCARGGLRGIKGGGEERGEPGAEPSRTEQSRTEQSRTEQSRQRPTMATSEPTPAQPKAEEQQSIGTRVANLPLVSSAYDMVASAYSCTKESHPYVRSVCDAAEKGVKTLTAAAVSGAQPLLTRLEPQISTANEFACKGLDKLEEKLPILQQPPEKLISDTKLLVTSTVTGAKDVLSSTVAGAKDAVTSRVTGAKDAVTSRVTGAKDAVTSTVAGAKDAVTSRVTGVVDITKGAVQGGVEMTRSAVSSGVNTVIGSTVGQMVASGVGSVLGKSEELVDHYLPMTDEELGKLATAVEGFEPEQQRQQQSYFVRLGSLSSKLRHRALQHSLGKLQSARQSSQELLAQLQGTLDLVEHLRQGVDQRLQGGQEKLQQLWLEWSKKQPGGGKDQVPPETVESGTLTMLQGLSQQLQSSCQPLLSSLQGLPASVQDTAGQVRHNVEELRAALASVTSLQDVTGPVLAQARAHATKARQLMDELVEHVAFNTPLTWLVGPFAPSGQRAVEME